ncbi:MAG: 2-oxo acid dehydrogenase subunit E2, partial [Micrococcales bacterium]|nr:2-oxo acid dehydrogenase subunit E2 [Micrococcales bacterium]
MSEQSTSNDPMAEFGANEWLVDELYQQYLEDKNSVDQAWWEFFSAYEPSGDSETTNGAPAAVAEDGRVPSPAPAPAKVEAVPSGATNATPTAPAKSTAPSESPPPTPREPTAPAESATKHPVGSAKAPAKPRDTSDAPAAEPPSDLVMTPLRGATARVVSNMESSLTVPTATSVRAVPAKLLIDNRVVINNNLARSRGGKVSFTHIIGYAMVKALASMPEMNNGFTMRDGKPTLVQPEHVNFGLAIDLQKDDGSRTLVVPSIKGADQLDFVHFWTAYEKMVRKARNNQLAVEDFQGTTITLTNPGGIGTVHSVPRLMSGQGTIIAVGALEYPAEWQGASTKTLNENAVSKILTLTSTYDHRIIQGAQSGDFLKRIHQLLLGDDRFYDEIFESLRIPYEPIRWTRDVDSSHDDDINKVSRVQELIHAYRSRGHLMADTDPLEYRQRHHHDLDVTTHGLTLW